jgi:hypothetical protein
MAQVQKNAEARPRKWNYPFIAALVLLVVAVVWLIVYYSSASGQISVANAKIADYTKQTQTLQSQLTTANSQSDSLKSQLSTVQGQLTSANGQVSTLQGQLTTANTQITTLQNRTNTILDTPVMEYYALTNLYQYNWSVPIPLRTYFYFKDLPRPSEPSRNGTMASDAHGDAILGALVTQIRNASLTYNLKPSDVVNLVATFSQSLTHSNKDVTTPYDDYPNYPIETLFQQGGDSEDNSILAAALLTRLDFNVVFFVFDEPRHVGIGVDYPASAGLNGWEYQGRKYVYLETTGQKWQLGQAPSVYLPTRPTVVPFSK